MALALCSTLASCFDGTAPGGARRASLSFVPVYSTGGVMDGTPSDVDSFLIVVSNPPLPDIIRAVRLAPGQDSITLSIDVDLVGGLDTVDVSFQGFNSVTGLLLYSGTQSFGVTAGTARPQPIPVSYVGPGTGVDSVIVSPTAAGLAPGGTAQLTYTGFDNNVALPDDSVPVWYASTDSLVARVSRSGLITAVANGSAQVFVTAVANRNLRDTTFVTVSTAPAPALDVSPLAFAIQDTTGTANPVPRTATVSNSGGGTLGNLVVGTIAYGAGASGWLTATLSGTTAPATLTLQLSNAGLSAGTYTATVPITTPDAANSPRNVTVTYLVTTVAAPAIGVNPQTFSIPDTAGTSDPAARTATVANTGGGTLTGLALGTISYSAGATGWLTAGLSGGTAPATLTLQASNAGLSAGTYTATVPVTSAVAGNSPQNVTITYVVSAPAPVAASLTINEGFRVIQPSTTLGLTVTARDGQGNVVPSAGTTFVSRAPGIATVNATTGLVTGATGGSATIVASFGGLQDSMVVAVAPNGSVMLSAVGDTRAFDRVAVNDTVRVLVAIDLRPVTPNLLASYTVQLNWAPGVLRYVRGDPVAGGFTSPTINATQAATGSLTFAAIDAFGHAGPSVGLVTLIFVGNAAGSTTFTGGASEISGPAPALTNYLPLALAFLGSVRVQ